MRVVSGMEWLDEYDGDPDKIDCPLERRQNNKMKKDVHRKSRQIEGRCRESGTMSNRKSNLQRR